MSRLEIAIERLRALSVDEQDGVAGEIEAILAEPASILTPEQWDLVDAQLVAAGDGTGLSHAEVIARMRRRFGR